MNMISTAFPIEVDATSKQDKLVAKLVSAWEKKNSKTARAGGLSLMALSLAACGAEDETPFSQADVTAAASAATTVAEAAAATAATAASAVAATAATAATTAATAATTAATAAAATATATAATAAASAQATAVAAARAEGVASVDVKSNDAAVILAAIQAVDASATSVAAVKSNALTASDGTIYTTVNAAMTAATATAAAVKVNGAFTTGLDALEGGTSNDSFSGSNTTLNSGDTVTGGLGTDTLAIFSSAAATIGGFTTTGVEKIQVSSTSSVAADIITVNMGGVSGETNLTVTGSSSSATFTNTNNIATLGLTYNSAGNVVMTYNASTVVGAADVQNITTTDTTNGVVNIAGMETLSFTNSGTSTIATLTAANAATVNVAGSGTLTVTDMADTVSAINAATYTGTLTVDGLGATNLTYTGGTGVDTLKMGVTLTKDDTIDGGAGADVLIVNNTGGAAMTVMPTSANISNIETLRIEATDDSGADAFTLNASIVDFTNVIIDASDQADTYAITNVTDEVITVTESANNAVALIDISLAASTGAADSATLNVTNADSATALTITDINSTGGGIETLNLVLNQGVDITSASDIIIADVSSTHSGGIIVTGAADATFGSGTSLVNDLDASAGTGDYTVTVGTAASTIKTGAGKDGITFDAAKLTTADTVNMGAGTDTLTTGVLAAGTFAGTVTGAEKIQANIGTAGSTISGLNISGTTEITIDRLSDEAATFTNLKAEVATVRIGNTTGTEATTIGYVSTAAAAHTVNIGDGLKTADVDLGAITVTGNTGAITINSDNFAGNSVFDITANVATSLTLNAVKALEIDAGGTGNGILTAAKATTIDINASGGALIVDGAQTFAAATTIDIDADFATTLTGAMTAAKATSLTVHADSVAFEQTGNFSSDADVTSVNLTAAGASASIRYNGILDVDHVSTINLTATGGGSVVIDDIEMLGVTGATGAADIDTAINITATGVNGTTGSNVTVTAVNTATATLDVLTVVSDSTATVNFTMGAANLTITSVDASGSLGTNVFDTSTSGAAMSMTFGTATKNTITTELGQVDSITLSTAASADVIKLLDDESAVDTVSNFKGGAGGDVVEIDISAMVGGAVTDYNSASITLANKVVMNTDANGIAVAADYTNNVLNKEMNILKLTDTFANNAAVVAAIDLDVGSELNALTNNDVVLVLWTNGADSFLSTLITAADDGASTDIGADLIQLVNMTHSTLTADNFEFI